MGWLIIFVTWGYVNSFGSFQAYYTSVLPESPSTISWIGSIQVFLTFFIGAFSGRLLDAGLFVPTLFVGGVLQLLGIFMMSLSTKWWQLLLSQGVLTGIGGGIFFCPSMGLIATYFSGRRALAVGVVTTGNSVGSLDAALLRGLWIERADGHYRRHGVSCASPRTIAQDWLCVDDSCFGILESWIAGYCFYVYEA
jgi:MFS family permease